MLDGCKVRTAPLPYGTVPYGTGTIEVDFIFHESAFTYVPYVVPS